MTKPNPTSRSSTEYLAGVTRMEPFDYSSADAEVDVAPRGIHVNESGTAVVRLANDAADRSLTLVAGQTYAYAVIAVRNSGTTASMGIFACY